MLISETGLEEAAAALVASSGLGALSRLEPLIGGANNRVFRVETGGAEALLKAYFRHPDDPRDRLGAEFGFASFAWGQGLRCLPRPMASDPGRGLALYEYVPGGRLEPGEVGPGAVAQALGFFHELNRHKHLPQAQQLPPGSEACFTLAEHLRCIERRVRRLQWVEETAAVDREAVDFICTALTPAWEAVESAARRQAAERGLPEDAPLPAEDRCLSPSDFGFHNAIVGEGRRLCFIDFEYAGWDDPAKTVCDFFCQPKVPVPADYLEGFVDEVAGLFPRPGLLRQRVALLLPVYRVKWCCILLNDFLPVGGWRRRFADAAAASEERKVLQLQKARQALGRLEVGSPPAGVSLLPGHVGQAFEPDADTPSGSKA
jgi:hypothetical protein